MNLAEPAPEVEPATAENVMAVNDDHEYKVEPAREASDRYNVETYKVDPAVPLDDPMKFAPTEQLNEPHRNPDFDIPVEKLRTGGAGVSFENKAGVCKGLNMTFTRKVLPFLYDERDFVSYGEILRYVVVKDHFCFVYGQETDPVPIFTVPIDTLKAVKENPRRPHKRSITVSPMANTNLQSQTLETILLLDARDSLAYQFTFDVTENKEIGDQFMVAVQHANRIGKAKDGSKQSKVV